MSHEQYRGEFNREGHAAEGGVEWEPWWWIAILEDGMDCESCGWSDGLATVETEDLERFEVQVRVGCYSGSHAEGDLDTVANHLLEEWGHLAYTKDVTKALRAAVAEAKEMA